MPEEEKEDSEKEEGKESSLPDIFKLIKNNVKEKDIDYITSYVKQLERKIRALEAEKYLIESEKTRLDREVRSIKTELDRMRQPPLVTANVVKIIGDGRVIVRSSTGPEFIVKYLKSISAEEISPGTCVAVNQRTFSIVEVIPEGKNISYSAYRAWQGFDYEVWTIEVQDWEEITSLRNNKFFVRLKNFEDLVFVVKQYRIPVIFKKSDEYLAVYEENYLFWYKPEKED